MPNANYTLLATVYTRSEDNFNFVTPKQYEFSGSFKSDVIAKTKLTFRLNQFIKKLKKSYVKHSNVVFLSSYKNSEPIVLH